MFHISTCVCQMNTEIAKELPGVPPVLPPPQGGAVESVKESYNPEDVRSINALAMRYFSGDGVKKD
ncbi:MAG: hypothetical protein Q8K36_05055, partial [Alphaproteobacteria bacterium]|nr:hypothetical protein [Alphaproteobacteria bacterium]